jgi:hypothetical protein
LAIEADLDLALIRRDAGLGIAVTGFAKHLAHKGRRGFTHGMKIFDASCFEFSRDDHALIREKGFAGNACVRIFCEERI